MAIPEASAVLAEKSYWFMLWAVGAVEKAPRALRYSLGERVVEASLDVVEGVVDAAYTRERTQTLRRVQLRIERLRFLIRALSDLKAIGRLACFRMRAAFSHKGEGRGCACR